MIFGMTYYEFFAFFLIYALVGWIIEVIYHAVTIGEVINRGFLCGPVCPVYGCGMVAILAMLNVISMTFHIDINAGLAFGCTMVLATLVELFAGWALDQLFHMRWWDYSDVPFNLHGYICLKFSIYWGLGGIIAVRIAHPAIAQLTTEWMPKIIGVPVMFLMYVVFAFDCVVTTSCVVGFNKRLKEINEIREAMRVPSDKMTERIAGQTLRTAEMIGHTRVQAHLAETELKEELQERKGQWLERREEAVEKYEQRIGELKERITRRNIVTRRMLKAFPSIRHHQYENLLHELKSAVQSGRRRKK